MRPMLATSPGKENSLRILHQAAGGRQQKEKTMSKVDRAFSKLERTANRIADERNRFKAQRDSLLIELKRMLELHGGPGSAYKAVAKAERKD